MSFHGMLHSGAGYYVVTQALTQYIARLPTVCDTVWLTSKQNVHTQ